MAYTGSWSDLYRETEAVDNPCNPHNSGLDFAGTQMILTWQNQDNTGLDLTESQKVLPWQNQDNTRVIYEDSQKRFSSPKQGVAQLTPAAVAREKKRLINKAYRERERVKKEKMVSDLVAVGNQNKYLKREHGRLRSEKYFMDQSLQAREAENQVLKTQVRCLKRKSNIQKVLVDAFSSKLLGKSHEDQQLLKLRQERDRLLGSVTWNRQMEEQKQLLERKVNLEHQNRALKFQVSALCEKILNDENH